MIEALEARVLLNAGDLDPAFGNGGIVTTFPAATMILSADTAIQPDGKIIVAAAAGGSGQGMLIRYNANGSLDSSFGNGGKITGDFGPLALQADGKILVETGSNSLARYSPAGTLDSSFGNAGIAAVGGIIAIQADGNILAAATGTAEVARLNPSGSLDPSFGNGGRASLSVGGTVAVHDVVVQPDGRIIIAGDIGPSDPTTTPGSSFFLARFTASGSPDPTFGSGGGPNRVGLENAFNALAVQPDGKIVATGFASGADTIADFWIVARFNSDGSYDPSFGSGGLVTRTFGSGTGLGDDAGIADDLVLQPDNRIVVAGTANGLNSFALARFNPDGSLDPSFGSSGRVTTAIGSASRATSIALDGNGIIVAGVADPAVAVARYLNDVTVPVVPTFLFPVLAPNQKIFVTGADAGGGPDVKVFDATTRQALGNFFAFNPAFTGGVRVAVGDVNGDGVLDVVCAAGSGGGPNIVVFNGKDGTQLLNFFAFDKSFTGGLYVAAGDVNGDGAADIVVGADAGGGPNVSVFSGNGGSRLVSYFPYDSAFTGGVRVGAGDLDGDGRARIITGAGPGGGPDVAIWRIDPIPGGLNIADGEGSFFAYDQHFTAGIYVSAGDVNGDGKADVIVGAGAGGGPNVAVFRGSDHMELASFFPYDPAFTGGVRVAGVNVNQGLVISVPGPGGGPDVRLLDGLTGQQLDEFFAYDSRFAGGLYVAGTA